MRLVSTGRHCFWLEEMTVTAAAYDANFDADPSFRFGTEVEALMTLEALAVDLDQARERVERVMAYMKAAVLAAADVEEDGAPVKRQPIIAHSGLSRRTVYGILGGELGSAFVGVQRAGAGLREAARDAAEVAKDIPTQEDLERR